ncbi:MULTISPECIES: glycosyltransferase family 2 protein [Mesorhizobium]|uniref:Glycosyltransferase family 2 protein n=1 Tax=Mesorhizobium abyssinicae TaxID=1209958 RepID=A0ABU5ANY8_9HYPH|nr:MULTISPECIES: glycosyltransferase family 2 protein [Mesorhizobium]MDX8538995.1 glycosyltransferase family 2 protein [Mesorhizobium abyssinicae]
MTTRSIVFPIYRNQANIPSLLQAIANFHSMYQGDIEFVFVVDGSPDESGALLVTELKNSAYVYKIIFHSRNFGSFTAIRTGLEHASGNQVAAMAADLQEPPELIVEFFSILEKDGADVVFGRRVGRDDPPLTRFLSKAFWAAYRKLVLPSMPSGGVDIFACNRQVLESILSIEEPNSSLVVQLFWVGFRREFVAYRRREREHGKSAWSMARRFRYMMDSIFSFSDFPIVLTLWAGIVGCALSLIFAFVTVVARLLGKIDPAGYTTLVLLITGFGSASLAVQGILGCYLWRAVENTKSRPLRIISRVVDGTSK